MTKKEQINIRDTTYLEPDTSVCCRSCKHYWNYLNKPRGECHAIEIRGQVKLKSVCPLGLCELWEHREEAK